MLRFEKIRGDLSVAPTTSSILRPPVITAALGSADTRAGVPDLALDSGLIDRIELDCQNLLTGHSVPPITARSGFRKSSGPIATLFFNYIIIFFNCQ